ncbi:DUF4184 family protein [Nocardia sp. NPDC058497]|uniref:DUF4184 family protein n=1 Tax=Nocardia sp. NPDC058497 TaxID=3346529 RepID=UPI0036637A4C
MPITLAHPVAVLPFVRHFPVSALVAGSIAPDVVYYLPVPLSGSTTHSPLGVLSWDLVIGLALLPAFRLSAAPAAALLPYRVVLPAPVHSGVWRRASSTIIALMLGAMTHIVWDSFTRTTGFAVQHWDLLRAPVLEPHKAYNVLGYASSLVGTAVLAYVLVRRTRRRSPTMPVPRRRAVLTILLLAPVVAAASAVDDPVTRTSTYDLIRHTIVGAAQGLGCAWTIYLLLWHVTTAVSSRTDESADQRTDTNPGTRHDGRMRISVTGHMNITAATEPLVRDALSTLLADVPDLVGITCLARGADSVFAEAVLDLGGRLEVVLPSRNYRAAQVKPDDLTRFDNLLAQAHTVRVMDFDDAGRAAYEAANHILLEHCDRLIAVWDGDHGARGGTATVVALAHTRAIPVDIIWPPGAARE